MGRIMERDDMGRRVEEVRRKKNREGECRGSWLRSCSTPASTLVLVATQVVRVLCPRGARLHVDPHGAQGNSFYLETNAGRLRAGTKRTLR